MQWCMSLTFSSFAAPNSKFMLVYNGKTKVCEELKKGNLL
jgi:hypothetical protein